MKSPPYKILLALILLSALVVSKIHSHLSYLRRIRANSLESANGYINVLMSLTEEMEWTFAREKDNPDMLAQAGKHPLKNLVLSDPLIPAGKAVSFPGDPLELKNIGMDSLKDFYALFQFGNRFFTVKKGDHLFGRDVIDISEDKVYLSSQLTRYLYHINGKKLLKRKTWNL